MKFLSPQVKFVLQTLATGLVFIPFILFITLFTSSFGLFSYLFLTMVFFLFIFAKSLIQDTSFLETLKDYCTFLHFEYVADEPLWEERLTITYVLIIINVFIHYGLLILGEKAINFAHDYLLFLPEKIQPWNLFISPLINNFLHADASHLWGNMLFLWIFGLVLERRIGWKKFLLIYLLSGVFSSFFSVYLNIILKQDLISSLGASGAISGIIGAFAFRLFYKRMILPVPLLGFLTSFFGLNFKMRVYSIWVIAFYFLFDFSEAIQSVSTDGSDIDYWGHIGGLLIGIYLASKFKFTQPALEEMMLERAIMAIENKKDNKEAEKLLRLVLDQNPERTEALIWLARIKSKPKATAEGQSFYLKAIRLLITENIKKAAHLFMEYFSKYRQILDTPTQLVLLEEIEKSGKVLILARVLEQLIERQSLSSHLRSWLIFRLANVFERIGFYESARWRYEQLIQENPQFPQANLVKEKLKKLSQITDEKGWSALVRKFDRYDHEIF